MNIRILLASDSILALGAFAAALSFASVGSPAALQVAADDSADVPADDGSLDKGDISLAAPSALTAPPLLADTSGDGAGGSGSSSGSSSEGHGDSGHSSGDSSGHGAIRPRRRPGLTPRLNSIGLMSGC